MSSREHALSDDLTARAEQLKACWPTVKDLEPLTRHLLELLVSHGLTAERVGELLQRDPTTAAAFAANVMMTPCDGLSYAIFPHRTFQDLLRSAGFVHASASLRHPGIPLAYRGPVTQWKMVFLPAGNGATLVSALERCMQHPFLHSSRPALPEDVIRFHKEHQDFALQFPIVSARPIMEEANLHAMVRLAQGGRGFDLVAVERTVVLPADTRLAFVFAHDRD